MERMPVLLTVTEAAGWIVIFFVAPLPVFRSGYRGAPLGINAFVVLSGMPPHQFVASFQLVLLVPTQVMVVFTDNVTFCAKGLEQPVDGAIAVICKVWLLLPAERF